MIDRDVDGEPTGILREAAQRSVQSLLPSPTVAQRREAIRSLVAEPHARGRHDAPGVQGQRPAQRRRPVRGLANALRAYTVNAARQDFADAWKGSIEPGKVTDLCVPDRDLLRTDPHDITGVEVDLTVFDGRIVFER